MPSILGKKKLSQTQIQVRKNKQQLQQPARKKSKLSFLGSKEQLIFFKVPSTIQVTSPRIPNDCVICSLEFLKIITVKEATDLRVQLIKRNSRYGITIEEIIHLLKSKLQQRFKKIEFRNIPSTDDYLLFNEIPPSHAFIVGLHPEKSGNIGHMVIFFKDHQGQIGLIDPQADHVCLNQQCLDYLKDYSKDEMTIFIGTPYS